MLMRVALYHPKLSTGGVEVICPVGVTWTTCSSEAILPSRASMVLEIGGKRTWTADNGMLELRNLDIQAQNSLAILDYLGNFSRASAWAFNPNALGAGIVVVCAVALSRSDISSFVFVFIVSSLTVFLSGSRAALVVLFLAFAVSILRNRISVWLLILTAIIAIGFFSFGRFTSTFDFTSESTQQRGIAFSNAFHAFESAPLTGVGDFQFHVRERQAGITHAHNLFLQTLAESGIFGLFPIAGLWILAFLRAFKRRSNEAIVVFFVVLSLNLFDYLFYYPPLQFAFWWAFAKTEVQSIEG